MGKEDIKYGTRVNPAQSMHPVGRPGSKVGRPRHAGEALRAIAVPKAFRDIVAAVEKWTGTPWRATSFIRKGSFGHENGFALDIAPGRSWDEMITHGYASGFMRAPQLNQRPKLLGLLLNNVKEAVVERRNLPFLLLVEDDHIHIHLLNREWADRAGVSLPTVARLSMARPAVYQGAVQDSAEGRKGSDIVPEAFVNIQWPTYYSLSRDLQRLVDIRPHLGSIPR